MRKKFFAWLVSTIVFLPIFASDQARNYSQDEKELILELYEIDVFNFNTENLNIPLASPYYIDLRHIISHPQIFKKIISCLEKKTKDLSYDTICGVPYAALAMAANVAFKLEAPLIMRRAHVKNYGTCKKIEGSFKSGMHCLIFEDVVTTAASLMETITDLENEELIVRDCVVLFDREQGGVEWMRKKGYNMHVIFTISDFMNVLSQEGKIDSQFAQYILDWTSQNQVAGVNWKNTLHRQHLQKSD